MKKVMHIYDYLRLPIRVAFFGFVLIAFGTLIQSESVNIFYTFRLRVLLSAADICLRIGRAIIINLPLFFMVNIVCKKANSGLPIVLAITGYITYLVTTMLFGPGSLSTSAYLSNSLFSFSDSAHGPLQTGLVGSFLIGYATRYSYMRSRHKSRFSFLTFVNRDTTALIYNMVFCFIIGLLMSYAYGFFYALLQREITYIAQDLMDPRRIALYGFLDRFLTVFGLGNLIRQPFWYTAAGGSYSNLVTGSVVLGDVNIWSYIREHNSAYLGAGRFITAYYVINIFMIPAFYLGSFLFISDSQDRSRLIVPMILMSLLSILCGNPLPAELTMLFTTPLLWVFYLLISAVVYGLLVYLSVFLGFPYSLAETSYAMPGSLFDLVINLRNIQYRNAVGQIVLVGLGAFAVMFIAVFLYYRFLAYDIASTGKKRDLSARIIEAAGGAENIESCSSGLFRLVLELKDLEKVSFEDIRAIGARHVLETRKGLSIELGSSSYILSREVRKQVKEAVRN